MFTIRIRQNSSKLREIFWGLGRHPERPEDPLEDPKDTQRAALELQWITPEVQIVDFMV